MEKQKSNIVLLHGRWPEKINDTLIIDIPLCNPNNEGNWMGWAKKHLEEKGYSVACPIIKNVWKAPYVEWKKELDKVRVDENTTLVGHSAGGYTLLRYLGESGKRVKKVILIAPGAPGMNRDDGLLLPFEEEFYSYEITSRLKEQIKEDVVILVSNDADFILRAVEIYKNILEPKIIKLESLRHFSFLIKELPELLKEIEK
jgi:predicted alpha/beta hydrolase family esterase